MDSLQRTSLDAPTAGRVCVIGPANVDFFAMVSRFPLPGESLIAEDSLTGPGGKGANQAAAAHRAGARVEYLGKVGRDANARFLRDHFQQLGLQGTHLLESTEKPTGNALIYVVRDSGENMIAVDPGANLTISKAEIDSHSELISNADIVLIQLEINLDAVGQIIGIVKRLRQERGREQSPRLILNPAPCHTACKEWLPCVDVLTPNATEAALLCDLPHVTIETAPLAARKLREMGAQNVLITLGSQGAWLSTPQGDSHIPPLPARPCDTTGAGDAFNGALAAQLAAGQSLEQAARFAAAYAAVSTERPGAAVNLPSASEAWERLRQADAAKTQMPESSNAH